MKAEFFRTMLNSLHENGLDLSVLDFRVQSAGVILDLPNGILEISVDEDGNGGSMTVIIP